MSLGSEDSDQGPRDPYHIHEDWVRSMERRIKRGRILKIRNRVIKRSLERDVGERDMALQNNQCPGSSIQLEDLGHFTCQTEVSSSCEGDSGQPDDLLWESSE